MPYQVIAIKWRPQTFEQLIGQEHITQTLLNALKNKRVPHAILFTGSRGVGKTSAARILAKSLKCSNNPYPCNQCPICKEITKGSCVDVMEIDGASHNGVDAIRQILDKVGYLPLQGQYKVCIIDEVHMLSVSAFNALLKTLEEPPRHIKFIFATTEIQKIPRTILSRCQKFYFRQIPTKIISQQLQKICIEDNISIDSEALWHIAYQAEGSMRDSQSLLDQTITFAGKDKNITSEQVIEILGLGDRRLIIDTVKALIERNCTQVLNIISQLYTSSYDLRTYVNNLIEEIKNLLFIKECTQSDMTSYVDLPDAEITELANLAQKTKKEDIHLLFDMALKGSLDILKAQDSRIVLEMLLLRMAHAPQYIDILDLEKSVLNQAGQVKVEQIDEMEDGLAGKQADGLAGRQANGQAGKQASGQANVSDGGISHANWDRQAGRQASGQAGKQADGLAGRQANGQAGRQASGQAGKREDGLAGRQASGQAGRQASGQAGRQASGQAVGQRQPQKISNDSSFLEKQIGKQFTDFVLKIKDSSPLLGAQLENISLEKIEGNTLILSLPFQMGFLLSQLKSKQNLQELEKQALAFWQENFKFHFQIDQKDTQKFSKKSIVKSVNKQEDLIHKVESLPVIQKLKSTLGAKIQNVTEMCSQNNKS